LLSARDDDVWEASTECRLSGNSFLTKQHVPAQDRWVPPPPFPGSGHRLPLAEPDAGLVCLLAPVQAQRLADPSGAEIRCAR
jgi:hypothetical protein